MDAAARTAGGDVMDACLFRLSKMLGVTVDDLKSRMTSLGLSEWCRWLQRSPEVK